MKIPSNSLIQYNTLSFLERLDDAQFSLIYIDPPWGTMINDGEKLNEYQTFISRIAQQCWRLLNEKGTLYFHAPPTSNTDYRLILNQIFSKLPASVIILPSRNNGLQKAKIQHNHNEILRYAKTTNPVFNQIFTPPDKSRYKYTDKNGAYYLADITTPINRPAMRFSWNGFTPPAERSWRYNQERIEQYSSEGRIDCSGKFPRIKIYFGETLGNDIGSVWNDIVCTIPGESGNPSELYNRILRQASNEGDGLFAPFCGMGQLLVEAEKLNRRWVGCDEQPAAIEAATALLRQEFGSTFPINQIDHNKLNEEPKLHTDYQDFFLTTENLEKARLRLARVAEFTSVLKNELAEEFQDDEEVISALQQMIPRFKWIVSDIPAQLYRSELQAKIAGFQYFEEESQEFIITAKFILETLSDTHDFSIVSTSAWKTIELELNTKILAPFRDWVLLSYGNPEEFTKPDYVLLKESVKNEWQIQLLADFIRGKKKPAIGQIVAIVNKCSSSKSAIQSSPSLKAFKEFIQISFFDPDYLLGKSGLMYWLAQKNIDEYRNGAAHTSLFSKEKATQSFEFVIKVISTFGEGLHQRK